LAEVVLTLLVISRILSEQYSFSELRISIVRKRLSLLLLSPPFITRLKNRGFGWSESFCTPIREVRVLSGVELRESTYSEAGWKGRYIDGRLKELKEF
jgi:hypothetical protein